MRTYFTGIKGVGLTALALCLQDMGFKITGSDIAEEFVTDEILKKRGIKWNIGFNKKNLLPSLDLVITTGAHGGLDNPEVVAARKMGIAVMTHEEALAAITEGKEVVAVCGVGGKSTTAAMIATIFDVAGFHPSFAIGVGNIPSLGTPGRYDKEGKVFVVEADEYAVSPGVDNTPKFLYFKPRIIVTTNIEHDHPDIYLTIEDTKRAFRQFFEKVPEDGMLIVNENDKNAAEITKNLNVLKITYPAPGESFVLNVPGDFNQLNASAAATVARFYGISDEQIRNGFKKFTGTRRRFEKMGEKNGVQFIDDYAHMPNEIKATLKAARELYSDKRIIAVFQPHTYSRTKAFLSEFAQSFVDSDVVIVMDIYASAREIDILGVSGEFLVKEVARFHSNAFYAGKHEDTIKWIRENAKSGDVVLTLGAGDIFQLYKKF